MFLLHRHRQSYKRIIIAVLLVISLPLSVQAKNIQFYPVTHGVSAGDVQANSAVIWSRTNQAAFMHVSVSTKKKGHYYKYLRNKSAVVKVTANNDFTGKVVIKGLKPETEYEYSVWFSNKKRTYAKPAKAAQGKFVTPAAFYKPAAVKFGWGGDVAGQNVCRDANEGFPIFNAVNALSLDFFVGLGDMIYADNVCEATGRYGNEQVPGDFIQSATLEDFWAHWKYNREDDAYRYLLENTAYYSVWDDHEVVNDFGPLADTRDNPPYTAGQSLLPMGLQAYLNYNAIREFRRTPDRLYRNVSWGKHLELIFLDNRQYRDANLRADDAELTKTMLGREQLHWLQETIKKSTATWKVIVSSVPISIPTGFPPELGRDGWANFDQNTGFEYEAINILNTIREQKLRNVIFITTDVHFAEVFRYTPFGDEPEFQFHEFVTGPMNAGLFPNRNFDDTLGAESLFFYGPESFDAVTSYEEARPWMNFGFAEVDEQGVLTVSVRDVDGNIKYSQTLMPE